MTSSKLIAAVFTLFTVLPSSRMRAKRNLAIALGWADEAWCAARAPFTVELPTQSSAWSRFCANEGRVMKGATELLLAYLSEIQDPVAAAALFADDGAIELPWVDARAQGPVAIEGFLRGLLAKVPDFRFRNIRIWIQTPNQAFGEYDVEALVPATGKTYRQTYAGRLVAQNGKIKLLREALDTAAASWAFTKD